MKKSKYVLILILFLFFISVTLNFSYYYTNYELLNEIEKRDTIISMNQKLDTAYSERIIITNKIIKDYFQNCNLLINGKKISTDELLSFVNNKIHENNILKDS